MKTNAVAYFRTSSASGLGDDKDSESRQRESVSRYADRNNFIVVKEFYDKAVKGADPAYERPAFKEMVAFAVENNINTVFVETVNRFARDLIVQLTGHDHLKKLGINLIPVDAPEHFTDETETAVLIRQILGAVSQFEKNCLVRRMKGGRAKKRAATGRCEGRLPPDPAAVKLARELRKVGWPYGRIGVALAESGFFVRIKEKAGKPLPPKVQYKAASVKHMLEKATA